MSYIAKILQTCFGNEQTSPAELEFVVRDGYLCIGRLIREFDLDKRRVSRLFPQLRSESLRPKGIPSEPVSLEFGTPGMLDTVRFVEDSSYKDSLGPDDVEMEAQVWALSSRDIFVALGRLEGEKLGYDCAGVVTRTGSAASCRFRPGDRIVMSFPGTMCSHPRALVSAVAKISDDLSIHDAVSVLNPLATAYYSLVDIARLRRGEKILIHSAAGGTGQMAIQVAQNLGAEIFATVGSEEKKQLIMRRFGISEDHIFYSRNTSFALGIKRLTGSVDVVLNSLSGDSLRESWECIAPFGRFIEIGKTDIMANSPLPMASFAKNVTFAAIDMHYVALRNGELWHRLIENSIQLLSAGEVKPPEPLYLYPVSEVEAAFRYMQSGKNMGRTILTRNHEDVIPVRHLSPPPPFFFSLESR